MRRCEGLAGQRELVGLETGGGNAVSAVVVMG